MKLKKKEERLKETSEVKKTKKLIVPERAGTCLKLISKVEKTEKFNVPEKGYYVARTIK